MRDLTSNLDGFTATQVQTKTGTGTTLLTSATIDLQGFEGVVLGLLVGASGDTISGSVYLSAKLTESDVTDSGYADVVTAGDLILPDSVSVDSSTGIFLLIDDPAEDDRDMFRFGYIGTKRFLRIVFTLTGTHTNGIPLGSIAIKGLPHRGKVANP